MSDFKKFEAENTPEWEKRFEQILLTCLERTLRVHDELGKAGEELIRKNQFGETALRIDIACEKAVIDFLKATGVPARIISEEHGQVDIVEHPRFLAVLDGLDGSDVYKKERGHGRYGTMLGIFTGIDPKYQDYLASGVMEHATQRLFFATKHGGAFLREDNMQKPIHASGKTQLTSDTKIYIDDLGTGKTAAFNKTVFTDKLTAFKPPDRNFSAISSAIHYVDVASGAADLALECTRKNNLEIATAYGLEAESGAVMVDVTGQPIGDKKYQEFGQKENIPIITAATQALAEKLLEYIKR